MRNLRTLVTLMVLVFAVVVLAELRVEGLWGPQNFVKQVPGKQGPGFTLKEGGEFFYLAKDGALYRFKSTGAYEAEGQVTGITNIVAPPTYVKVGTNEYIIYVTAQGTSQNRLVVHRAGINPQATPANIDGFSYGLVAYASGTTIEIFTGTMNGTVYKFVLSTVTNESTLSSLTVNEPIKVPPVLDSSKSNLYIMTQSGKLYRIDPRGFGSPQLRLNLSGPDIGEFTVPMAVDEGGFLYALSTTGSLYKIDPSGHATSARPLGSSDSAGVLIDGDGYIYVCGGRKIAVLNQNFLQFGEFDVGQQITTTPGILKGYDGITYVVVPSSANSGSGAVTILSFNPTTRTLTRVWRYETDSSFPISAAVGFAPTGSLMTDDYYMVTGTNDGKVYAWKFNGRAPYGNWAVYGQNAYRTGFVDSGAVLARTRIRLVAKEGRYGKPLSNSLLGVSGNYGLLYDANKVTFDGSITATYTAYRTNETDLSKIPEGIPGAERLVVQFSTPTTGTLLLKQSFQTQGGPKPATDSVFEFAAWQGGQYEGTNVNDNPATLTFRFNDRTLEILTQGTYTIYVYHKYPTQTQPEATRTIDARFLYNPTTGLVATPVTVEPSTTHLGQQWYAFRWNVWQWDPDNDLGYNRATYYDVSNVRIDPKGPAYVEIYYAQLNATLTLLLPEFAYGRVRAYLFLDAEASSLAYSIDFRPEATGVRIYNAELNVRPGVNVLTNSVSANRAFYVLQGFETPLATTSRVATVTLTLDFDGRRNLSSLTEAQFASLFYIHGYAQLQGQLVDPENLRAKRVYKTNKFLYVVGDFNYDFVVDLNDWNLFVTRYDTEVSGADLIFNIGPREDFTPPYPDYNNYRAGFLTDTTNRVDAQDLFYFVSMFGFVVPESERVQ